MNEHMLYVTEDGRIQITLRADQQTVLLGCYKFALPDIFERPAAKGTPTP